jgi:hypothetical protein
MGMETNNELTATAYGRTFTLTLDAATRPNLRADLLSRGFDGEVYMGESKATGRQRGTKHCMFYRSTNPAVGFVPVVIL